MTKDRIVNSTSIVFLVLALATAAHAQRKSNDVRREGVGEPLTDALLQQSGGHHGHQAESHQQADKAMGFSQSKTTHHFRLFANGGVIEVEVNDLDDVVSRNRIREHLIHIAKAFSNGDFAIPHSVHSEVPPGVEIMTRLRDTITYKYQATQKGGLVRISTDDPQALAAVHQFLRYQIKEHRTGDLMEVRKE